MNFNKHYDLEGKHAILGASKYQWLNYDDDKTEDWYLRSHLAVERGIALHELAYKCIKLKEKLPNTTRTINMYVNDAIGYRMTPELVLKYSNICFGTADAISYYNRVLRIHDLKTGVTPGNIKQLVIYAALFCLEYNIKPGEIEIELRIYQNNEVLIHKPTTDETLHVMDKIKRSEKIISQLKDREGN